MEKLTHPDEVVRIYERILEGSSARGRYIDIGAGRKIHLIEAGVGPPLVYLHGGGAAAHTAMPLLQYLEGLRMIVPDRPGNGLSDFVDCSPEGYRDMAVEVTSRILEVLGLDQVSLAGSSGGGVWAIWYALAHPERVRRLVLLGSAPLLPGTYAQVPMRMMAMPIIGDIIARLPSDENTVIGMMGMMGEKETILKYPEMIEALAASNNDPVASKATQAEFSAFLNLLGFRANMKIRPADLARLRMPTLVIWGEHDPLGGADVARAICAEIPNCLLELLPAGHVPFLGYPEKAAKLMLDFVLSG